jgi:hypothetical protein
MKVETPKVERRLKKIRKKKSISRQEMKEADVPEPSMNHGNTSRQVADMQRTDERARALS